MNKTFSIILMLALAACVLMASAASADSSFSDNSLADRQTAAGSGIQILSLQKRDRTRRLRRIYSTVRICIQGKRKRNDFNGL